MKSKFIWLVLLLSSCATSSQRSGVELGGEWKLVSQSSTVCQNAGPHFESCEIVLMLDHRRNCLAAKAQGKGELRLNAGVDLNCQIKHGPGGAILSLAYQSLEPVTGKLLVDFSSDPEMYWETKFGKYRLLHVSREVRMPPADLEIQEE